MFFILGLLLTISSTPKSLPGDLPNPYYNVETYENQEKPVPERIKNIISPTVGHPVTIQSGKQFALWTNKKPAKIFFIPSDNCGKTFSPLNFTTQKNDVLFRTVVTTLENLPRATYNLKVVWSDETYTVEKVCLRSLGRKNKDKISILFLADHQLRDPSWEVLKGLKAPDNFPKHGKSKENLAITQQQFHEMKMVDPDIVIHLGDLLYGLDFFEEYQNAYKTWSKTPIATYFIPGNHDGYATYSVSIPGLKALGFSLFRCRDKIPTSLKTSWFKIFQYLSCVYSDAKDKLFQNLVADGLVYWRNIMGPTHYSFKRGKFYFIFLNTYSGTNKRRHSFSIYIKAFKRYFGAPAVDNYGGYLSVEELKWIKKEIKHAKNKGLTPIYLAHHDPRGNMKETAFHENESFPTSPIGLGHFEEWNFDEKWDSNPNDTRGKETTKDNSAVTLLKMVADSGGYYISGHVHKDGQWVYKKGELIAHGVKAKNSVTFIKITTAASSRKDDGYWGYRYLTGDKNGKLEVKPYFNKKYSIPAGNFYVEKNILEDNGTINLYSSLPKSFSVKINVCLPTSQTGYRLKSEKGIKGELITAPFYEQNQKARYTFLLNIPKAVKKYSEFSKKIYNLKFDKNNNPPKIKITADGKLISLENKLESPKIIDGSKTIDIEKDKLYEPHFIVDNKRIDGFKIDFRTPFYKEKTIIFKVRDEAGAWSSAKIEIIPAKKIKKKSGGFGCGCKCVLITTSGTSFFAGLLIFLIFIIRKRRLLKKNLKDS
jgi:Calcineurin-like phosphoesterase